MTATAIQIRGASKSFGPTRAVRSLDLDVPAGSLCGFLGPNGAGKTTTIRMVMSIILPDEGVVDVLGGRSLDAKDRIGYLPEERGLYRRMRVGDFLRYIGRLKGLSPDDAQVAAETWLERMELPGFAGSRCQELSKGMQQKVQFIAAILHDPELIILDEPFAGLDPMNASLLHGVIRDLHAAGRTIIFSTHVLHQAERLCDRIFLIDRGVKLLDATMENLRRRFDPRTIEVRPLDEREDCSAVPGVAGSSPMEHPGTFELRLEVAADPQVVMRSILDRHAVRSVQLRRPSLDEIFCDIVRHHAGEAEAARAREALAHG